MRSYPWTRRVAAVGFGILAIWVVFVAVVRIVNVPLGGIQPEAFVLIAMMTAPFTLGAVLLGAVLLATLVTAGLEMMVRRLSPARA